MQGSARRDPARELAVLVRAPEPGSHNLGEFVADHADDLAQAFDADPHQLARSRALDDEDFFPRVLQLLERARRRQADGDFDRRRERSIAAAVRLGQTVRWTELGAELDVDILLGDLLADRTRKWVSFDGGGLSVTIPRHLIAGTRIVSRQHLDLGAYVDEPGLHFRWRGGKGRYNWRPHDLRPGLETRVLAVPLASKVVPQILPAPKAARTLRPKPERDVAAGAAPTAPAVAPTAAATSDGAAVLAKRRGGAWLKDIIREIRDF